MTTVLLIEDDDLLCRAFKRSLELRGVTTIQASSVEEGQRLFHAHRDSLDAIVMDGCLNSPNLNTLPLIKEIKDSGFAQPIIAASGDPKNRRIMMAHGCTHAVDDKTEIISFTLRLLKEAGKL